MTPKILLVVSNITHYPDIATPTGLWLSELSHAYDEFERQGYQQVIVSPQGGPCPLEPRSLKWPNLDRSAKAWQADPQRMALLKNTVRPEAVDPSAFDAIYFTGGHAVMWDFPDSEGLQMLTRSIVEQGGIVGAVCHGYCGLLNTRLSSGDFLVNGRKVTGFSWTEEILAGVAKKMPYNAEQEMRQRGARYQKALLPFLPFVVTDGQLVTGQNPQSAKATARQVVQMLSQREG